MASTAQTAGPADTKPSLEPEKGPKEIKTSEDMKEETKDEKPAKVGTEERGPEIEIVAKDLVEENQNTNSKKDPVQTVTETVEPRKNSIVNVAVIKETNESSSSSDKEELEASLQRMPGMTSSKSQEILKALDEKEIKDIAENLNENGNEKENGSMIDISVVEESDNEKDVQEVIKAAESGFQAEVIEDNEDIEILPSENEEVIEYTIEMKHAIPVISVMVALVGVFYALIFHYHI